MSQINIKKKLSSKRSSSEKDEEIKENEKFLLSYLNDIKKDSLLIYFNETTNSNENNLVSNIIKSKDSQTIQKKQIFLNSPLNILIQNKHKKIKTSNFAIKNLKKMILRNLKKLEEKVGYFFMGKNKNNLSELSKKNLINKIYKKSANMLIKPEPFNKDYFQQHLNKNQNFVITVNFEKESKKLDSEKSKNDNGNKNLTLTQFCLINNSKKKVEKEKNKKKETSSKNQIEEIKYEEILKNDFEKKKQNFELEEKRIKEAHDLIKKIQKDKKERQNKLLEKERKKMEEIMAKLKTKKSDIVKNYKLKKKLDLKTKITQIKKRTEFRKKENELSSTIVKDLLKNKIDFETKKSFLHKMTESNIYKENLQKLKENNYKNKFNSIDIKKHEKLHTVTLRNLTLNLKEKRLSLVSKIQKKNFKLSKFGKKIIEKEKFEKVLEEYNQEVKKGFKTNKDIYSLKVRMLHSNKIPIGEVDFENQEDFSLAVSHQRNTIKLSQLSSSLQNLISESLGVKFTGNGSQSFSRDLKFSENIYEESNIRNISRNIVQVKNNKPNFFITKTKENQIIDNKKTKTNIGLNYNKVLQQKINLKKSILGNSQIGNLKKKNDQEEMKNQTKNVKIKQNESEVNYDERMEENDFLQKEITLNPWV